MAKIHRMICAILGWIMTFVGILATSLDASPMGSPTWWAALSALPIGALFLIAFGVAKAPTDE